VGEIFLSPPSLSTVGSQGERGRRKSRGGGEMRWDSWVGSGRGGKKKKREKPVRLHFSRGEEKKGKSPSILSPFSDRSAEGGKKKASPSLVFPG